MCLTHTSPSRTTIAHCILVTRDQLPVTKARLLLRLAAAKKEKWLKENPGQMVITAGQMVWTAECEKALSDADGARKALKLLKKKWISYLNKLTAVTCSKLSPIDRNKVSTAHDGRRGWRGGERKPASLSDVSCAVHASCRKCRLSHYPSVE